jgi:hypothetical protein
LFSALFFHLNFCFSPSVVETALMVYVKCISFCLNLSFYA